MFMVREVVNMVYTVVFSGLSVISSCGISRVGWFRLRSLCKLMFVWEFAYTNSNVLSTLDTLLTIYQVRAETRKMLRKLSVRKLLGMFEREAFNCQRGDIVGTVE